MRTSIVIVDDFYAEPHAVRDYALREQYYHPYQRDEEVRSGRTRPKWLASSFKKATACPFKASRALISTLEDVTGASIDLDHWNLDFPTDAEGKAHSDCETMPRGCLWNCCFHVKLEANQELGEGVHNHVTDIWNSVGEDGWTGLVYLSPDAPLEGGLKLWRNLNPRRNYDWMTSKQNWTLIDDIGNLFNRLILVRGNIPHSGAAGWGRNIHDGRLFQTFFFKVKNSSHPTGLEIKL